MKTEDCEDDHKYCQDEERRQKTAKMKTENCQVKTTTKINSEDWKNNDQYNKRED